MKCSKKPEHWRPPQTKNLVMGKSLIFTWINPDHEDFEEAEKIKQIILNKAKAQPVDKAIVKSIYDRPTEMLYPLPFDRKAILPEKKVHSKEHKYG